MTWYVALALGLAVLFYAAIPGIGGLLARGRWRVFRRTVVDVSRYPTAGPKSAGREPNVFVGLYRFFGTLEAIQGDDRIWITNGRFSVAADLRDVRVYLLPEGGGGSEAGADAGEGDLRSVPWSSIFSLPEGTPVLVGGALFSEEGRGVFRAHGRNQLLVVIHDCPRESIMERVIWGGRHRNEYMNPFTLPSVATGALSLVILAYSLLANPENRIAALVSLTVGLAPVSPFLPPGFPLYFAYRHFWKKARLMRAHRDVVRLPLRYFPRLPGAGRARQATLLPDMEPYIMIRGTLRSDPPAIVSEGVAAALPEPLQEISEGLPGSERAAECVVFGAYREQGDGIALSRPEDPMAELVLVRGDPETIAGACDRAALRGEIVSALFIALNIAVNLPLVFLILSLLVR